MKPFKVLLLLVLTTTATLLPFVSGDVFLHNPRGSNNRGCESNDNANSPDRVFNSQANTKGGYACPYAFPFACYTLEDAADRQACNQLNSDQDYDDISGLNMMDEEGVLHEQATRTPRMYYYEGSELQIEWTNEHGCGGNTHCDIVLQYACEDTLTDDCGEPGAGKQCGPRDGVPLTNNPAERGSVVYTGLFPGFDTLVNRRSRDNSATATIPVSISYNVQSDPRFARHEPLSYYLKCLFRERNKGLFTADLENIRDDATGTRQNSFGSRYGYECPEESNYYPYWQPSPWKDIAILTDRVEDCPAIVAESQNVKGKHECDCPDCQTQSILVPINEDDCIAVGGTWTLVPAHDVPAPECGPAPTTPVNQHGIVVGGKSVPSYKWTIPSDVVERRFCILRIRYNISSADPIPGTNQSVTISGTSEQNGVNSPLKDRQLNEVDAYKSFTDLPVNTHPAARLGLAMNTQQFGRTFQDRSYTFEIRKPPTSGECAGKRIYNLNVRGKRGNFVQVYPALQYDFVPNELYVKETDCIHVQWTGSDYNPARNANDAYGGPPDPTNLNNGRSDRNNMVQIFNANENQPVISLDDNFTMFTTSLERKLQLAFIGQAIENSDECMAIEDLIALSSLVRSTNPPEFIDQGQNFLDDNSDRDRYWKNCGKLSGARTPYFDGGLFVPGQVGTYHYMSTRSHSFSNRNVQGTIHVQGTNAPTPEQSTNQPSVPLDNSPSPPSNDDVTSQPSVSPTTPTSASSADVKAQIRTSIVIFVAMVVVMSMFGI